MHALLIFVSGRPRQGDSLLLDDGKLRMTVADSGDGYVNCRVDVGGKLSDKKGVNTPSVRLPISAMTPKVRRARASYQGMVLASLVFKVTHAYA